MGAGNIHVTKYASCMHFLAVLGDKSMNVKINFVIITVICTETS